MASVFTLGPVVTNKVLTTSAARIASNSTQVEAFTLYNPSTNTGVIYIGASNVSATLSLTINAGETINFPEGFRNHGHVRTFDLNNFWAKSNLTAATLVIYRNDVINRG